MQHRFSCLLTAKELVILGRAKDLMIAAVRSFALPKMTVYEPVAERDNLRPRHGQHNSGDAVALLVNAAQKFFAKNIGVNFLI